MELKANSKYSTSVLCTVQNSFGLYLHSCTQWSTLKDKAAASRNLISAIVKTNKKPIGQVNLQDKGQSLTMKCFMSEHFADRRGCSNCGCIEARNSRIKIEALTPTYKSYLATTMLPDLLIADAICAMALGRVT